MTVSGVDKVLKNLHTLDGDLRGRAMTQILAAAAQQAEGHVKVNAREEFYTGEPRGQTGNLLNSIQTESKSDESVVYVGAEYGVYLEMGTSRGITPRHYVKRGVVEHMPEIRQAAIIAAKKVLGL